MADKGKSKDLPIIAFSTDRYMDRQTLGRIRSHAQQRVQDRKRPKKSLKNATPTPTPTTAASSSSTRPQEDDIAQAIIARSTSFHTMDGREEPFNAFPVSVNAEFMQIFDTFYDHWNWRRPKDFLFRETMSHATLTHSFLAVSYRIWRNDSVQSMSYANKTIQGIMDLMTEARSQPPRRRPETLYVVTCAIVRLALLDIEEGHYERAVHHLGALNSIRPELDGFTAGYLMGVLESAIKSLLLANSIGSARVVRNCLAYPLDLSTSALDCALAQGFAVPPTALFLQPEIQELVASPYVTDIYLALTAVFNTAVPYPHSMRQSICGSQIALRLSTFDKTQDASAETELQACLRRTATIFSWSFDWHTGEKLVNSNEISQKAREENREAFARADVTSAIPPELLLWMLCINGGTSEEADVEVQYVKLIQALLPDFTHWSCALAKAHIGSKLPWTNHDAEISTGCEFWSKVTGARPSQSIVDLS